MAALKTRSNEWLLFGIALTVGGLALVWALYSRLPELPAVVERERAVLPLSEEPVPVPTPEQLSALATKKLFVARMADPPPPPVADVPAEAVVQVPAPPPPKELPLELRAILYSNDARLAVFQAKDSGKLVRLRNGDEHSGVKVMEVRPKSVQVRFDERDEELSINDSAPASNAINSPKTPGGRP